MTINHLGLSVCFFGMATVIVVTRWLHPATFSVNIGSVVIAAMLLTAVAHIWYRDAE